MQIVESTSVKLRGAAISSQGGRPENQDDFGFQDTPLGFLFIICDGMGGGPGGKAASYIVKYEMTRTLLECSCQMPCDAAFRKAVSNAHEALVKKMQEVPSLVGMGSTFVAVLISGKSAFVAHAGDSRCYQIRNKKKIYRSVDHSLVSELVQKKALTEEQARRSPQSNIITRGLGSVSNNVPEIEEVAYKAGDRFVLCTDGVWGIMPEKDLMVRLTAQKDISDIVPLLAKEIDSIGFQSGGHHDNHTLGILEMNQDSLLKDKRGDLLRYILMAVAGLLTVLLMIFAIRSCINNDRYSSNDVNQGTSTGENDNTYIADNQDVSDPLIDSDVFESDSTERANILDSILKIHGGDLVDTLETKKVEEDSIKAPQDSSAVEDTIDEEVKKRAIKHLETIIANLEKMLIPLADTPKKKVEENKDWIIRINNRLNMLQKLNINVYKQEIENIKDSLTSKYDNLILVDKRDKKTRKCQPTRKAIEEINDVKKMVENILEKIKK